MPRDVKGHHRTSLLRQIKTTVFLDHISVWSTLKTIVSAHRRILGMASVMCVLVKICVSIKIKLVEKFGNKQKCVTERTSVKFRRQGNFGNFYEVSLTVSLNN